MSDPGFTFYTDNFIGGTLFFTDEQVGKYMRALCAQKMNGHLTFEQLNTFTKDDEVVIRKFIVDDDGLYYNVRLDKEINKRAKFLKSQSEKAKKRWENNAGAMPGDMPGVMPGQCRSKGNADLKAMPVNEIETEIKTEIKNKRGVQGGEKKPAAKNADFCKRKGKKVSAQRHGTYVLLADGEYRRMVDDWGEKFAKAAITEYDERYPNSEAIRKHTDHNLGIRDYVRREFICRKLKPQSGEELAEQLEYEKKLEKELAELKRPEVLGTPEERLTIVRETWPSDVRTGKGVRSPDAIIDEQFEKGVANGCGTKTD